MVGPTSLLSVMHESSKRVSETLQEIYSSEWDGHEELKAIVGVRVSRLPALQHSLLPSAQPSLSFSIHADRKVKEPVRILHVCSLSHGW